MTFVASTDVAVTGNQIGDWRLLKRLAVGAAAELFLAAPAGAAPDAPGYVAKVLREQWREHPLMLQQFRQEAELTRQLRHPHLITRVDARLHEQPLMLIFPYLRGRTVAQLIESNNLPPALQAVGIARQTAAALSAIHAAGYLHGDVKPANMLVASTGHVTLLDLGSAQQIEEVASFWDRPLLGTPRYLAPERYVSKLRVDHRADLYSLGLVLFELFTGQPAFDETNPDELARQMREAPLPDLRRMVPQLPAECTDLVQRLTARHVHRRPESAVAVVQELARIETGLIADWAAGL